MSLRDILVVGASAGGVEALSRLVSGLPEGFPAAIFVVIHFPRRSESSLPSILGRKGKLPALHAIDGAPIQGGTIVVAPPDHHLQIEPGYVRLSQGPPEHGHRPAINPLFRSAARAYGPRVIGVILTGLLHDGTVGLRTIKRHGGVAMVQDPADAAFSGMPLSAIASVAVDYVLPIDMMPLVLARLVAAPVCA